MGADREFSAVHVTRTKVRSRFLRLAANHCMHLSAVAYLRWACAPPSQRGGLPLVGRTSLLHGGQYHSYSSSETNA